MSNTVLLIATAVLILAASIAAQLLYYRLRVRNAELREREHEVRRLQHELAGAIEGASRGGSAPRVPGYEDVSERPVPDVPAILIEACATGECVLFAGTGLAAQAELPTWRALVALMVERLTKEDPEGWAELHGSAMGGDPVILADLISSRVPSSRLTALISEFLTPLPSTPLPASHRILAELPLRGVITNGWDKMIDAAFFKPGFTHKLKIQSSQEEFGSILREKQTFLLRASGDIAEDDVLFTTDAYIDAVFANPAYGRFVSSLLGSQTFLFIGTSLDGIESFLATTAARSRASERRHYALVPFEPGIELQVERMSVRYNLELLLYAPTPGHPDVARFLESLRARVRRVRPTTRQKLRPDVLGEIELTNIGPHTSLTLELTPQWNVLLGDNGCGKSSILRAVALALSGDDDRTGSAAARLLKVGASSGSVSLRMESGSCTTELVRDVNRVRVLATQITPVQAGSWLVLGFPPLRGVSTSNPTGPSDAASPSPAIEDVLPLLEGVVDARLDNLKQWVVNTSLRGRLTNVGRGRETRLLKTFFNLVEQITPGLGIEFAHVDQTTWDVLVTTEDGVVPVDVLSQGMNSILSWGGTLLQRLYETYPDDERPQNREAFVIIDEIDAHLHPEWQSQLVPMMRSIFPRVQVLATTHSPLIVGNLKPGEIFHFRRDKLDGLVMDRPQASFRGWRADQILTGPVFGLASARDDETKRLTQRYRELLSRAEKTETDVAEIERLAQDVGEALPSPDDFEATREAAALLEEWMRERLRSLPDTEQQRLVDEAKIYLAQLRSG